MLAMEVFAVRPPLLKRGRTISSPAALERQLGAAAGEPAVRRHPAASLGLAAGEAAAVAEAEARPRRGPPQAAAAAAVLRAEGVAVAAEVSPAVPQPPPRRDSPHRIAHRDFRQCCGRFGNTGRTNGASAASHDISEPPLLL